MHTAPHARLASTTSARAFIALLVALTSLAPLTLGAQATNPPPVKPGRPAGAGPATTAAAPGAGAAPATAARDAVVTASMPVKRITLYKSGVGFFEHIARVRGNQSVSVDFTSSQLDDVLSSLTTIDLDGGRVTSVGYNSQDAVSRKLGALRLPIGEQATRAQFLAALRGAKLDVQHGDTHAIGRLLSVEPGQRHSDGVTVQVDLLTLVSDAGEMQTIPLDPGVGVHILDADLTQQVGKYLSLVASERDQDMRRLSITTAGAGSRDLFVSYLSEVPVWKASYRLVLPAPDESAKPLLQGWAIVDNTVGQDWKNVELTLVSGAPQSFIQQISLPYYVQRPLVPVPGSVQTSPQTHAAAVGTGGPGLLTGSVTNGHTGAPVAGATVRLTPGGHVTSTDESGRYRLVNVPPGTYEVEATRLGYTQFSRSGVDVSGGTETILNAMVSETGLSLEMMQSTATTDPTSGVKAPFSTTTITSEQMPTPDVGAISSMLAGRVSGVEVTRGAGVTTTTTQLGDLFEYKIKDPVTIRKNQSALLPILSNEVDAERVSLWNASSPTNRPLRAVWLTNSTSLTLDGGSFTVIEGEAFAGEGLMDPLKAGERRLLSYATDLGLQVDAKGEGVPVETTARMQLSRGLLIQHNDERQRKSYTIRNENIDARTLVIEHPVRAGWTLVPDVPPVETTSAWYRFRVAIAPKTTVTFTVEETHPGTTTYSVGSVTDDDIAVWVRTNALSPVTEASLRDVIARKAAIGRLSADIASRQLALNQITADQQRVRANMASLKGSAEEKALLQRYVKQLGDQETQIETMQSELTSLIAQRDAAQVDLNTFILGLTG